MLRTKRRKAALVVTLIALIAATAAFAAWYLGSGSGPGAAKGGSTLSVTLDVGAQVSVLRPGHTCYPSGDCDLGIYVSNPGPEMTLQTVAFASPASVVGDPSCNIAPHLSLNAAPSGVLIPGGATTNILLGDLLHSDATLPSCAAGADWSVPLSITSQ